MKIALIAEHAGPPARTGASACPGDPYPGDPAAGVLSLARALAARQHQVSVYARQDGAARPGRAALGRGVTVEYLPAGPPARLPADLLLPHVPAFCRQLAERWRRSAPDVVHACDWTSGLAALGGVRDLGIPVAATLQPLVGDQPGGRGQSETAASTRARLEAAVARTAQAVLVASSADRAELVRRGVPQAAVSVVPPGVDTATFQPFGPAAARGARPRLLMITPLTPPAERPELAIAVRALADVPEAELLVVSGPARGPLAGDPGYRALTRLARQLGVHDRLTSTAAVSQADMPALMRSADVLLSLTTSEPFAMVPLEAMACGLAVIASGAGPSRDAVIDGVTGYLVAPGPPALLAARISQLLAHPMIREGFGIAAASRAQARYSWERVSQETLGVYEALPPRRLPAAA
jgi:glycosyltransferase involved in cell wall biosynthesis